MTKLSAKLVGLTQPTVNLRVSDAEGLIAFCARVSNPQHQDKELGTLLNYCMRNKHYSIFQMINAVVEIEGPRDITRQFTRHSSMYTPGDPFDTPGFDISYGGIQEFSQRYSDQIEFTDREFRKQDNKNRQNSTDDLDVEAKLAATVIAKGYTEMVSEAYGAMREAEVAKECARVILPEGLTMSRLYVNGTLRSWLHYLEVRDDPGVTQWEHVLLARKIREALAPAFPTIFKGLSKDG